MTTVALYASGQLTCGSRSKAGGIVPLSATGKVVNALLGGAPYLGAPTYLSAVQTWVDRRSVGWYTGSNGVFISAPIGIARQNYTWNGSTWILAGTLIEPASRNLTTQCSNIASWPAVGAAYFTTNQDVLAPDGTYAYSVDSSSTASTTGYYSNAGTTVIGNQYTASGYIKWVSGTQLCEPADFAGLRINPFTGAISGSIASNINAYSCTNVGNGWFRWVVTFTAGATTFQQIAYIPNLIAEVAFWGFQLEAGGNATSLIPTAASAVSRTADLLGNQLACNVPLAAQTTEIVTGTSVPKLLTPLMAAARSVLSGVAALLPTAQMKASGRTVAEGSLGTPRLPASLKAAGQATLRGYAKTIGKVSLLAKSIVGTWSKTDPRGKVTLAAQDIMKVGSWVGTGTECVGAPFYLPTTGTFTGRASTGTYFDQNGILSTASVGVARENYVLSQTKFDPNDPVGSAGYQLVFDDEFTSLGTIDINNTQAPGFNWYVQYPFGPYPTSPSAFSQNGSVLTINVQPDGSYNAWQMCTTATVAGAPNGYVGNAWTGEWYIEAAFAFDNTVVDHSWDAPAFWGESVEHCTHNVNQADQWPGQIPNYVHFIEDDWFEYNRYGYTGYPACFGAHYIDWSGPDTALINVSPNPAYTNVVVPGIDWTQFNRIGCHHIPASAANGWLGSRTMYVNGVKTTNQTNPIMWLGNQWPGTPAQLATSQDGLPASFTYSATDNMHISAIFGSHIDVPLHIDYMRVWQANQPAWVLSGTLIEPASTNLLHYSENFTAWAATIGSGNFTVNYTAVAPDGGLAYSINSTTTSTTTGWFGYSYSTTIGNRYTASGFIKCVSGIGDCSSFNGMTFNSTNGTLQSSIPANVVSYSIIPAGGGWYYWTVTFTATGSTYTPVAYCSNEIEEVAFWGYQLEALPYATSYIPTTTVAITRAADFFLGSQLSCATPLLAETSNVVTASLAAYFQPILSASGGVNVGGHNGPPSLTLPLKGRGNVGVGGSTRPALSALLRTTGAIGVTSKTLPHFAVSLKGVTRVALTSLLELPTLPVYLGTTTQVMVRGQTTPFGAMVIDGASGQLSLHNTGSVLSPWLSFSASGFTQLGTSADILGTAWIGGQTVLTEAGGSQTVGLAHLAATTTELITAKAKPTGVVTLSAGATANIGSISWPTLFAQIFGSSKLSLSGQSMPLGIAWIAAKTQTAISATARARFVAQLSADTLLSTVATAKVKPILHLAANALIRLAGSPQPRGVTSLAATGKITATARVAPGFKAIMSAATTYAVRGALKLPDLGLALATRTVTCVAGLLGSGDHNLWLYALSNLTVSGATSVTGSVKIAGTGLASVRATAKIRGLTQLKALGSAFVRSETNVQGVVGLQTQSRIGIGGSASIPKLVAYLTAATRLITGGAVTTRGRVKLAARNLIRMGGRALSHASHIVFLTTSTVIGITGRAKVRGVAHVAARGRVAVEGMAQTKGNVHLYGKTLITTKATTKPHGKVTLEGASTRVGVRGKLSKAKFLTHLFASSVLRVFGQAESKVKKHYWLDAAPLPPMRRVVVIPERTQGTYEGE